MSGARSSIGTCGVSRRALLLAVALASSALTVAAPVSADPSVATMQGVTISGHGYGHGVGLSQWGAEERASAGQTHEQILSFYYPGATIARAPGSNVRILVAERPSLTIGSGAAFTVSDASGRTITLPAGRYTVASDLTLRGAQLTAPVTIAPSATFLTLGAGRVRGTLTLELDGSRLQAINTLELEQYIADVVSCENPAYWPPEALRAQAIASRSYALANLRPDATFDLYDDDRSQNYRGLTKEYPTAVAATAATRGQVLRYHGRLVNAFFSASNGGVTRRAESVFGGPPLPYLATRPDRFDAMSPPSSWGPVLVSTAALHEAYPQLPAAIVDVRVIRNDAGGATLLTFEGADGATYDIDGSAFTERLGLRSPYFSLTPVQ